MTETPQLLLAHHLKSLKLPTFQREYDKLARPAANGRPSYDRRAFARGAPPRASITCAIYCAWPSWN